MWFANSNFINMSPDANKIIDEVLPNISTIVTVDPYWTWTAKYSDYVLPACNYWEKWDFLDRSPWVFFQSPAVTPAGESKSDVEIMSLLAGQGGPGRLVEQDRRGVGAQLRERGAPGLGGLRFRQGRGRGHLGHAPTASTTPRSSSPTACSPRLPRSSPSTTTTWWSSRRKCPATSPCWRIRRVRSARSTRSCFCSTTTA